MAKKFSIQVIFDVLNKATAPLNKIGLGLDRLAANANRLGASLDRVGKKLRNVGKGMTQAGKTLSTRLTLPILGFGALALRAWDKQAKAVAQVEAGIKATGGAAGRSLKELKALASDLQENTLFGDEAILAGATAQLLTFTNIAGKVFDRTQKSILDVATKLAATKGGAVDLTGTSIMLGKALNDPIKGLAALSRVGIAFTKDQTKVIKSLAASGKMADAQNLILQELEKQYGGSAAAAAAAGTGGFKQLTNQVGDLTEDLGKLLFQVLGPLIPKIRAIVKNVQEWVAQNPKLAKLIITLALVAAAIGPIIFLAGSLTSGLGFLFSGIGMLSKGFGVFIKIVRILIPFLFGLAKALIGIVIAGGPILWTIMAIAVAAFLIIKFWKPIKKFFIGLWDSIIDIFNNNRSLIMALLLPLAIAFAPFILAVRGVIFAIKWLIKNFELIRATAIRIVLDTIKFLEPLAFVFLPFVSAITGVVSAIGWIGSSIEKLKVTADSIIDPISEKFTALTNKIKKGLSILGGVTEFILGTKPDNRTALDTAKAGIKNSSETKTEVVIKVQSEPGSSAAIDKVKNTKGKPDVNVSNDFQLGFSYAM